MSWPLSVVDGCSTKHNANTGHGAVQVVHSQRFFISGSSNDEYNDVLWPELERPTGCHIQQWQNSAFLNVYKMNEYYI